MNNKNAQEVIKEINSVIFGKEREVKEVMLAILAGGHILLEDIPGVGKTSLAVAFSNAMTLEHKRIQFTPDLMPMDLTGFSVYQKETEKFIFYRGSVFCNLLLADEINRASPKTQSALLEVMEEEQVTVEGVTRKVPKPFIVIATQNPAGSVGTQLLPEAQVDRFMISTSLGYPDYESELMLARVQDGRDRMAEIQPIMNAEELLATRDEVNAVYIHDVVYRYLLNLVTATREHQHLDRGGSPRATISLVRMAKAAAWLSGRNYVVPADVTEQFPFVMAHRLMLNQQARVAGVDRETIIRDVIESIPRPDIAQDYQDKTQGLGL